MPTNAPLIDDPNVKIPDAVRRNSAAAEELHKQTYGKNDPPAEPTKSDKPAGDQPVTLASNALTKDAPLAPPTAEPEKQPETPPQQAEPPKGEQNWEHAFKSVNGRYQRAQETLRNNASEIANLQSALQQANARIQHLETQAPRAELPSELTPKEREDYGEEFLAVVAKQAKKIAAEQTAGLQQEVEQLKNRVRNVDKNVVANDRNSMKAVLDKQVPNWREINDNAEFLSWLGLRDRHSGVIRHNMLKEAWTANQTDRVLSFFESFIADEASTAPSKPDAAGGNPPATKVPLESFAAPGRASIAAATAAPAEKPIITSAQISKFHDDVRRGLYRGKEADKHKMDLAIFEAAREGRVR